MFRSLLGFEWQKSKAHLFLLSQFLRPKVITHFNKDYLREQLGENLAQAIKRFKDDKMLVAPSLAEHVATVVQFDDLRKILRERGLPATGKKGVLVERLIQADPDLARKVSSNVETLICSERGRSIAESFLSLENEKRASVETFVLECLRRRKFLEASQAVAKYESEQIIPRGMNIDWKKYDSKNDDEKLKILFAAKPKILSQLDEKTLEPMRIAAGMDMLWGENRAIAWLPQGFNSGFPQGNEVACRMLIFYAQAKTNLDNWKRSGVVKSVRIGNAKDSCEACKNNAKKKYKLNDAPELPHERCTHALGCRCVHLAEIDF